LSDPSVYKLAIQSVSPEGDLHKYIAGLHVPLYLVPFALGILLMLLAAILIGTAAAFLDLR
jgi:hypothetical protein